MLVTKGKLMKNYETIHFIQENMQRLNNEAATSIITRMYNRLEERKCYASALSTSISLYIAMRHIRLDPKLILGTVQFQGLSYAHAWLELDEKIIDLAIHEDVKYHPVLSSRNLETVDPQIYISYEDAAIKETKTQNVCYYPFQFGDTWEMSNMKRVVGKTFEGYAEESPMFDIWLDVCYILDISETQENIDQIKEIARNICIKDE